MEKVKNNRKKFIIISLTVIIVIVLVVATIESVTTGRSLDECFFGACCGILYMTEEFLGFTYLSDVLDTIPYEVLIGISNRVKRVYFQD